MKIRKIAIAALSVVVAGSLLTACGGGNSKSDDNGKTKVTFWAAPNPTQVKYWDEMAKAYEKENPDVTIEVSQMKESPSSEATIQSAIASKTAPTMSENINRSFAAQLADSKAIVPLNDVKGLDDVVKERNMSETMDSWKFSDGNQYVLPVYSNPILFAWRLDTLKELGYDAPPKTYSEALEVGKKLKAKYPDKVLWAKGDLSDPTAWMRWFDFFPLYDAASKGNAFVEDGKLVADDKAGTELLTFMSELQKNKLLLASKATDPFETGTSIMADNGPWTFPNWDEKFPELKYNENYAITAPLVPDSMANEKNIATYADSKGVVMYAQATDKEKEAAMDFLKFVYNDDKNDLKFLETTNLIPARDDATENKTFTAFFKENPELEVYAANVPYSIPAMDDAKYNDIQQILGEEAWNPVVRGEKKPAKAWSDMKKAEDGVLQE
ncbi:carbohydrate ABC transporter substrate-binding protein [Listeria monocytogenes]|uniref:ABC transporter substrate-binding protein n=1 Tax=Listeria monocytogenes TaxID=1639 RepID=UPI00085BC3F3|nr:ABC transporter substrate-binding protein [Listeria monocytogenes]EAC5220608.1 carbohydrate ABC transporter substrate-binding protein [Listeria monocytogenes]EAC8501404.1 carbohydrate ABC transporter substrate-binding protein [Listeria monocytogenes]EAC9042022.1 carbohydrate ABC transporter substrate-binding protein [Listeria monocytogenes]EAD0634212.1 carbohydrate ABC transporter substrate-binding protein [Listeria monocytogenes]EAD2137626.1 carbohydrate ABC transporter substrate-binding p